jgi:hypothetical protein
MGSSVHRGEWQEKGSDWDIDTEFDNVDPRKEFFEYMKNKQREKARQQREDYEYRNSEWKEENASYDPVILDYNEGGLYSRQTRVRLRGKVSTTPPPPPDIEDAKIV